ncbi:MAG: histidinol dehydrogenase [Firmicutes bacterium]|nr:histidinol dehydrogenase [Bacillota bacterium]
MIKVIEAGEPQEEQFIERFIKRNILEKEDIIQRVTEIIKNVKQGGDRAIFEYTKKFDGVELAKETIKVKECEVDEAYGLVGRELLEIIRRAKKNIEDFHLKQKENSWVQAEKDGIILGQIIKPLETVGVYVPGGTAPLISSVLMNIVPAKVAGVDKVFMATPPGKDGKVNPAILVAAKEAGADSIYKMGGAQAIAAFAFGTESVPKVDKIIGPGNIYVVTAKKLVYGYCDIDMFAGPSEIAVVADDTANPEFIAADLLSQAEHDTLASAILLTTSRDLAEKVQEAIERQYSYLDRKDIIKKALSEYGAIIIVENIEKAIELANRIAPEHLELCVEEPFSVLSSIRNAGAIFLGQYSSEPVGDYCAGPSHVLPTGGTTRFFSPLNVGDFMKKSSIISYSRRALHEVKDDIIGFARAEGLTAHANAIKVRFERRL